jgi:hypothetical protein
MRTLLLALPFALLPLAAAQAAEHGHNHSHGHESLDKHQHGLASLNLALEGNQLEIELESPAMNILGFEHLPKTADQQAQVTAARSLLEQPLGLFVLPSAAGCKLHKVEVESPLFGNEEHDEMHSDAAGETHSEIDADYDFTCSDPQALDSVSLAPLFKAFPGMQKITVQLVGPNGQKGSELTPANASIAF